MSTSKNLLTITPTSRFCVEKIPPPCGMVIFGASGDLAFRKLIPSIIHLDTMKLLPKNFFVVGCARTKMTDEAFRERIRQSLAPDLISDSVLNRFFYHTGDYAKVETYQALRHRLTELDRQFNVSKRFVFYLSIPPTLDVSVIHHLANAGLITRGKKQDLWSRVVVEKPFGRDLISARQLNREIHSSLSESQLYRIDHYLGKETVQNILLFRFANSIFEPVWNHRYIDHVQITAAEDIGVEHRAGYYDQAGALRDMFQNHMLQLIALTAMERPVATKSKSVRDERVRVIKALRPLSKDDIVRGQYASGQIENRKVPSYREEKGVRDGSVTETFIAAKFHIDNKRWRGVPFYCRSGKRLARKFTEIAIQFKPVPKFLFEPLIKSEDVAPNVLTFRIQPAEGISISFQAKQPGPKFCMNSLTMDFDYKEAFGVEPPEAYERLLLDCMLGDPTLFTREDDVEISWRYFDSILKSWSKTSPEDFPNYASGSWGPKEADDLIKRDGRSWRNA